VNFSVAQGAYAVLMGSTGCGKTSVVEAICGLRPTLAGTILVGGKEVTREHPGNRGIGYVPQDGALFETMTVRQHLAFALRLRKWEKAKIQERVEELAGQLKIESLLERRPRGLSGGEVQRVAIGRALSFYPKVLILDEPLSALDETTQEKLITLLQTLHQNTKVTVLHITHHRREAERLGNVHLRFVDNSIVELESVEVR
jgi:ABC-type sugar transport system ATPase subunit